MFRRISNRHLRQRFFGWIRPAGNDNFNVSHLKASIKSEEINLKGRRDAVKKYEKYAITFSMYPQINKQALEMAYIEQEAIPHISKHLIYLKEQLIEELKKELG